MSIRVLLNGWIKTLADWKKLAHDEYVSIHYSRLESLKNDLKEVVDELDDWEPEFREMLKKL